MRFLITLKTWGRSVALLAMLSSWPLMAAEPETATWTQWRGPQRDGQVQGQPWPNELAQGRLTETWQVALGPSYSGPIVTRNRVFVTETIDKQFETVRALDRSTGQEIWRTQWDGSMKVPFFAASNGSWIRATPAYDGERLYVAGMCDLLVCLNAQTGERLWAIDFVKDLAAPRSQFGFVSSPLLWDDYVYVQGGAGVVKLDKFTGRIMWRALQDGGGMYGGAFSSPTRAVIHDIPQLLIQTRSELAAVNPEDGGVLWKQSIPAFRGMNILTPTVIGNSVFTSSYGGRSFLYAIDKQGDSWVAEETWTHKSQGYMSTPIVIDHHIYLHLRNRRFICLDARTGEERWVSTPFGKYWSMIANGDHILALDQRGELLLIQANSERFELVDRRKVVDDSWAHLAACNDEVFVRSLDALVAFRWR